MSAPAPPWMRRVLLAAAAYNILWGAFVILFPGALFRWLGMAEPNYPALWQCIGMIVGVYGVGYAVAASDPARHWPIVLVGLLGKLLGPIGMVHAVATNALPWKFAAVCLTNDLIWWVPFWLILRHALRAWQNEGGASHASVSDLLEGAATTSGRSLAALSRETPLLVVFLRHSGCTFCREALADLQKHRAEIESGGTRIALVHMGDAGEFAAFAGSYGLADLPAVADPQRVLYRGLGLRRGGLRQLLGLRVWLRGTASFFAGHKPGPLTGDVGQMPGAFLIHHGKILRQADYTTAGDRPDYVRLSRPA